MTAAAAARSELLCPLCGNRFDPASEGCKPSCPLSNGCTIVCCPHCKYGFPRETGLAAGLRRLLTRLGRRTS